MQHIYRMYGDNLENLEKIALKIFSQIMTDLEAYQGKPFDPNQHINEAMCQIIATLVSQSHFNVTYRTVNEQLQK